MPELEDDVLTIQERAALNEMMQADDNRRLNALVIADGFERHAGMQASPQTVLARAQVYLDFLIGDEE